MMKRYSSVFLLTSLLAGAAFSATTVAPISNTASKWDLVKLPEGTVAKKGFASKGACEKAAPPIVEAAKLTSSYRCYNGSEINVKYTSPVPPPSAWNKCADEEGTCTFTGRHRVRYGASPTFSIKVAENSLYCSNNVFGDPVFGVPKICEVEVATTTLPVDSPGVPVPPGNVLDFNNPAVKFWVRADKTNLEIGNRFLTPGEQFSWIGVQGSGRPGQCSYEVIEQLPEPNTFTDPATGQPRVILARKDGWFQHRIWDGMCGWTGAGAGDQTPRYRSAIHTHNGPLGVSSAKYGREYWFTFGGKFYPDVFSPTTDDPNKTLNFMDFHHESPSSALSGATPWACYADRVGYFCALNWNRNDSGVSSPTGETNWDGAQRITLVSGKKEDISLPIFFAFKFKLTPGSDGYVESYRQIGVDGPIERIGRWNVPTTYSGSNNTLFPKYGLHQWLPPLSGAPTRSIDMAGAMLVEDINVPVEVIFRSLTVAIPRR